MRTWPLNFAGIVMAGTPELSHKHHYVPEWYQRRFLEPEKTAFKILDMRPSVFYRSDGSVAGKASSFLDKGPAAWFFEKDLYSIRLLGVQNDDIERMLFGPIDSIGKRAIDAFISEDWNVVHHTYWNMFEFMDALRLRTPKGLRFLKAAILANSQLELMSALLDLRKMHCLMWAEGALEIFSAEESQAKFIFSDHPVTFFNQFVFPNSPDLPAGIDPPLEWKGTQTLFPFDRNRLFVLTHTEWTRYASSAGARKPRTNARYFDNSMVRYDKCVRKRALCENQVRQVNYIIKARAERYIAAATETDLFPERFLKTTMWNKLGKFLRPEHSTGHGGQLFVKNKDGTYYFQDEFGRRPQTKGEADAKVKEVEHMHANAMRLVAEHFAKEKKAKVSRE